MTVYQSQTNGYIALKVQSAQGTPASGSGAILLRTTGGQGGRMTKAAVQSAEVRRDLMMSRGRHGSQKSSGTYSTEVSIDAFDLLMEAVFRGTWEAAVTITQAAMTSAVIGAHTITAGGGSWITAGLRVGDVIRPSGLTDAANNARNLRVVGLTATVITVAETLTINAVPDTTFSIVRVGQKLINPAAGLAVPRYFTVEEYEGDIGKSEVFQDVVFTSLRYGMQPDGLLTCDVGWTGTGFQDLVEDSDAPLFTTPTEGTGDPLSAADATLRVGDEDIVDLTSFDVTVDIGANAPTVAGAKTSPTVFTGSMGVAANMTTLRKDFVRVQEFIDEVPLSLQLLAVENESEPKDFFSLFIPNFTLGSVDKSALSKDAGPRTQAISIPQALVGKDNRGGAWDPTMVKIQTSNT